MSDQKSAVQQFQDQYKVAGAMVQDGLHAWNDFTSATTEATFDLAQKNIHYGQHLVAQSERSAQEALTSYRQLYEESLKTWQGYVQGVSDLVARNVEVMKI